MIRLRSLSPSDWELWRELRLQALAEAPGAFSSTLAQWQDAAPEAWQTRLSNVPLNVIADLNERGAGMIGATEPNETGDVELISLWVAPFARGCRVGDVLVKAVIEWAREQHASSVILTVRETNRHAIALYERHGFTDVGANPQDPAERRMRRPARLPTVSCESTSP